jgi:uncharacterized membrane protein YbhN (UPF0104 family)
LGLSALALYFVFRNIDLFSLRELLFKSNPFFLAGSCLFFIFSKVLSAYRLKLFFDTTGISVSSFTNLKLYWLGMFYNLFLPGGIGGDGYKVYYLNRTMHAPVKKSILALVLDRVTGLVALGVLAMVFGLFVKQTIIRDLYFILAMAAGTGIFYFIIYRWFRGFYGILHRTNLQSLGVQLLQVISAWLILKSLGHEQQTIDYLFVFLFSSVVAAIPFTIGGIGAREIAFMFASKILHLDLTTSVTLSLLFFLITAVVSLAGILYAIQPAWIENSKKTMVSDDMDQ